MTKCTSEQGFARVKKRNLREWFDVRWRLHREVEEGCEVILGLIALRGSILSRLNSDGKTRAIPRERIAGGVAGIDSRLRDRQMTMLVSHGDLTHAKDSVGKLRMPVGLHDREHGIAYAGINGGARSLRTRGGRAC